MMRSIVVVAMCGATAAHAQSKAELPAIPSFELPAVEAGYQDVRVLRLRGKALHGQNMRVKGYVTWTYDCKKALAKPGRSERRIRKMIEKNPSLCGKGQLRLGGTKDAGEGRSILIVQESAAIPTVQVGDFVSVTGTWKPNDRGEVGQLAFASLVTTQPTPATAAPVAAVAAAAEPPVVVPRARTARPVAATVKATSIQALAKGNKALAAGQPDAAITAYREATVAWDGNHSAWYALGIAHVQKRDWPGARTAWERAAALLPSSSLYQQWLGIATYAAAPDQRDAASKALRIAVKLDPKLWRAHYTLGRVQRDGDRPRDAAESLGRAIATNPRDAGAYIALAELYRRWEYLDQAIAVATVGTAQTNDSELWYVLGTAHDDKREDDKAIAAFTKSLERRADNHKAKFARGRVLLRKGDKARAKQDFDEFVKAAGPELDAQKQIAIELSK